MIHTLYEAVSAGNLKVVEQLLMNRSIPSDSDWSDYKLLRLALEKNHKEVGKFLLDKGCRVYNSAIKDFKCTPLKSAIIMQDLEIVESIMKKGIKLKELDHRLDSPARLLLETENKEIICLILQAYVDEEINPTDTKGLSPFHVACSIGNVHLVKQFLTLGNYVNYKASDSGNTPLHYAIKSGCFGTVDLLVDKGADMTTRNNEAKSSLHLAFEQNDDSIINLLLTSYYTKNPNSVGDIAFSYLHKMLFYKPMVNYNISNNNDNSVFKGQWNQWTPLHYAVAQEKIDLIEFLLYRIANIDAKDDQGMTALHIACQYPHELFAKITSSKSYIQPEINEWILNQNKQISIVTMLLNHNSNVNAVDRWGKTPLFHVLESFVNIFPFRINYAVREHLVKRRKKLIELLLKYGADVTVADKEGITILHDLAEKDVLFNEKDKIEVAKIILSKGANINAITESRNTALYLSIRNKYLDLARLLISHNANIKKPCTYSRKFTLLHALTYYCDYSDSTIALAYTLLENGADVNAVTESEETALHIAIDRCGPRGFYKAMLGTNKDEIALALLNHGAKVNAQDKSGHTPLHKACLNRYSQGAAALLDYGADIDIEDEFGNTPFSGALYMNHYINSEKCPNFFYVVRKHVIKLNYLGFYISEKNNSSLKELEKFYTQKFELDNIDDYVKVCAAELKQMSRTILDSYTSLYDMIFKSTNSMINHMKNDVFVKIVSEEDFLDNFPQYGYLIKNKFKIVKKRVRLMKPAEKSLKLLTRQLLPDSCVASIFEKLSDNDLHKLIESTDLKAR